MKYRYTNLILLVAIMVIYATFTWADNVPGWVGILGLAALSAIAMALWTMEYLREKEKYDKDKVGYFLDLAMGGSVAFILVMMTAIQVLGYGPLCSLPR